MPPKKRDKDIVQVIDTAWRQNPRAATARADSLQYVRDTMAPADEALLQQVDAAAWSEATSLQDYTSRLVTEYKKRETIKMQGHAEPVLPTVVPVVAAAALPTMPIVTMANVNNGHHQQQPQQQQPQQQQQPLSDAELHEQNRKLFPALQAMRGSLSEVVNAMAALRANSGAAVSDNERTFQICLLLASKNSYDEIISMAGFNPSRFARVVDIARGSPRWLGTHHAKLQQQLQQPQLQLQQPQPPHQQQPQPQQQQPRQPLPLQQPQPPNYAFAVAANAAQTQFRPTVSQPVPIPMGSLQPQFSALAAAGHALPSTQSFGGASITPNIATLTNGIQYSRIASGAGTATFSMQAAAVQPPPMFAGAAVAPPVFAAVPQAAAVPPISFAQRNPLAQPQQPQQQPPQPPQTTQRNALAQLPPQTQQRSVPVSNSALLASALPTVPLLPVTPQMAATTTPQQPPSSVRPPQLTRFDSTPLEPSTIEPSDIRAPTPLSPTGAEASAATAVAAPLTLDEQLTANHKSLANSTRSELHVLLARRGVDFRALSYALAGDAKLDANVLVTTTVPPRACTSELFWWSAALPTANGVVESNGTGAKKRARTDGAAAQPPPTTSKRRAVPAAFQEALQCLRETGVTVEVNSQSHRIVVDSDDACVTRGGWRVLLTPRFADSDLPLPAFAMDVVTTTFVTDATPESFRISLSLSDDGARVEALQHALQRLAQRAVQRDLRDVTSLAREWCTILLDPEPHLQQ